MDQLTHKPHCWWCSLAIELETPIPTVKWLLSDHFYTFGQFCSWSCARAYSGKNDLSISLLMLYRKRTTGIPLIATPVIEAPPRACLDLFGGPLSVEEYKQQLDVKEMRFTVPERPMQLTIVIEGAGSL